MVFVVDNWHNGRKKRDRESERERAKKNQPRAVINLSIFIHQININWMRVNFCWIHIFTQAYTAFNCKKEKNDRKKSINGMEIVVAAATSNSSILLKNINRYCRMKERIRVWDGDRNQYIMCKNHVCEIRFMRTVNRNAKKNNNTQRKRYIFSVCFCFFFFFIFDSSWLLFRCSFRWMTEIPNEVNQPKKKIYFINLNSHIYICIVRLFSYCNCRSAECDYLLSFILFLCCASALSEIHHIRRAWFVSAHSTNSELFENQGITCKVNTTRTHTHTLACKRSPIDIYTHLCCQFPNKVCAFSSIFFSRFSIFVVVIRWQ